MSYTAQPVVVGGKVTFWDHNGKASLATVVLLANDGAYANLYPDAGGEANYVPRLGQRDGERRWCFEEVLVEDFDPTAQPPEPRPRDVRMGLIRAKLDAIALEREIAGANPITSICAWDAEVKTRHRMAEALCMEEMGETMSNFFVHNGEVRDYEQINVANALREYSLLIRKHPEIQVASDDLNALVDGHLDSAWVHLLAAAQIVGANNLAEAWSRLHRANIDGKRVDGRFILDETGKVTKPEGWKPPTYHDLIKEIIE